MNIHTQVPTRSPNSLTPYPLPPTPDNYYGYTDKDTSTCPLNGQANIQGPAPFANKGNVALQFFAFGDTPYDRAANTCIASNGRVLDNCDRYDCWDNGSLQCGNTCTYVDSEYDCVRDSIIPYMNRGIADGDAAFIVHCGDILRESIEQVMMRCFCFSYLCPFSMPSLISSGCRLCIKQSL